MKKIKGVIFAVAAAAVLGMGTAVFWHWAGQPCILREDFRGKGVSVERIKQWEEENRDGAMGVLRLAGWRIEKEETISSESTGREERAQVIGVYGSMELVEDLEVLSGRWGMDVGGEYSVISEGLARELFGSTAVAGEWVRAGKRKFLVAGVTKKEEAVLWMPIDEGDVEMLALEMAPHGTWPYFCRFMSGRGRKIAIP